MLDFFLILLVSHLLTDFVFQTETLVSRKHSNCKKEKQNAFLTHSGTFFIISLVLLLVIEGIRFLAWSTLGIIFLLALSHYGLDLSKVKIQTAKQKPIAAFCEDLNDTNLGGNFIPKHPVWLFLTDQIAHIVLIILVTQIVFQTVEPWNRIFPIGIFFDNDLLSLPALTIKQKSLLILCVLIMITSFANTFIKISLSSIKLQIMSNEKELKIGRYIGTIERILTVAAIIAGAYEAIAALYASKTAIRFGQTQNDPRFGEYFMLGTSISALFGIVAGVFLKMLLLSS